jgi:hypothetical protein
MTCPLLELLLLGASIKGLGLCKLKALQHEKVVVVAIAFMQTTKALTRI